MWLSHLSELWAQLRVAFQEKQTLWKKFSCVETQLISTHRFINEGTCLRVDDHEHYSEHSGAQSQGAQALFILQ